MFKHTKAFSGFSADDLQAAKRFYNETLGLEVTEGMMGILTLHIEGGGKVIIYPKPNHVPAEFTVLNFPVADVEKAVDELTAKGVQFEQYDFGQMKTDKKASYADTGPPSPGLRIPRGISCRYWKKDNKR